MKKLSSKIQKWIDDKLVNLLYEYACNQAIVLDEMTAIYRRTYCYAIRNLRCEWYSFKIEVIKSLLSAKTRKAINE